MKRKFAAVSFFVAVVTMIGWASATAIPPGTQLPVRVTENLSSANSKVGQVFHGTLEAPIMANGRVVYPKGSQVTGQVVAVHPSGRLSDPGVLDLKLTSISSGRSSSALNTLLFHIKGDSHAKANVAKIGGTAAAGTVLGAIFGGGKGALIGAGAGAAAGTVAAAATGKKEAKVESEAVLPFVTAAAANQTATQAQAVPAAEAPPDTPPAPDPAQTQVQADNGDDDQPAYGRRYSDDQDDNRDYGYRQNDRERDHDRYQRDDRDRDRYAREFSDDDRRVIRSCYARDYSNLPPGLARRDGDLPPGLERHLERDGTLPPGLQKRLRLLPRSCDRRLSAVPQGWFRAVLSGRILLLDADYRVMDMFFLRGED
jgi:hypothetical protein